ncbi:beta-carotene hydroxylase 2, chloroplastic-like [Impatiens glandulifera]|uniref:beta-carotene hydroxylase 2, chloroplastic-like n=1 Tax=Impatiens glandulifera TaxID=253017 RepID=UPI001FB0D8DC|nr:beta-carotene hydroxylase 2, chloroplastic-like [Impatiens glandulifera]
MAVGFSIASLHVFRLTQNAFFGSEPKLILNPASTSILLSSPIRRQFDLVVPYSVRRKNSTMVSFVAGNAKSDYTIKDPNKEGGGEDEGEEDKVDEVERQISSARLEEKLARKQSERFTYLVAAVMSTFGITSMAVMAVYYRFHWQMEGGEIPYSEMFGTFALSVGAAVGMEFWARWAHKALWHASLWNMHESHHRPREGAFELNDVFAIINAVPAIALLYYGFFNKGLIPCFSFGAGLGITVFGMAYMFVHDGLVHKRFAVGPIANVPYLRKVAAAHQLHHSEKFDGVPYGLFLGPKELEEVGGLDELEKEINRRIKLAKKTP